MKIICSDLYSQTLPKSRPSFSFGVHKHIYIYIGIINWQGIGYYKLKRHVVFKRTNCFLWNHLCWLTENLVFASISQLDKEASVTATNWSVRQPMQPHTDTGGCIFAAKEIGTPYGYYVESKPWIGGWSESLWGTASQLVCESKWQKGSETSRSLSLHSHPSLAVFGPKVPGESFIWVAATCYYLCERTCKCILVRL